MGSPKETGKEKAPRLYHTKSRNGCQRCRARRVKCNETRPVCGNCNRHGVSCIYNKPPGQQTSARSPTPERNWPPPEAKVVDLLADYRPTRVMPFDPLEFQQLLASLEGDDEAIELLESKSRRILELRLQQNFIENISRTLSACDSPRVRNTWAVEVPKLALSNDNVLYGMLALSASHLLKIEPNDQELLFAHQIYTAISLREHRIAVALLGSGSSADAACFATTLIYSNAFASLQHRDLNPWTPPMRCMLLGRGCGSIYGAAFDKSNDFQLAKIMPIAAAEPSLNISAIIFADRNRRGLEDILEFNWSDEIWDDETRLVYEKCLNYIGGIRIAIDTGEHQLWTCRRLLSFTLLGPGKFCSYVAEQRPRALVVLAHWFALFASLNNIWWVGDVARREVEGILRVLPQEWRALMMGPQAAVGLAA